MMHYFRPSSAGAIFRLESPDSLNLVLQHSRIRGGTNTIHIPTSYISQFPHLASIFPNSVPKVTGRKLPALVSRSFQIWGQRFGSIMEFVFLPFEPSSLQQ